jgi:PPM family protein phosphatase
MRVREQAGTIATYTHPGRRRANQDAVVVFRLATGAELIAVADGMGGHAAGEVASAAALDALVAELEAGAELASAMRAANAAVYAKAKETPDMEGMGTTLVALLRDERGYVLANVGDSRAYLVSAAAIEQITRDHSYVAEALRQGTMTEAEAENSPWRNALTRAIGTDAEVEVDVFGPFAPVPAHAILLCTDGLYRAIGEEVIREYVLSTADLTTACEALGALAFRRGSDDNISLAIVEFETLQRRPPTVTLPLPIQLQSLIVPAPAVDRAVEDDAAAPRNEPEVARSRPAPRRTRATVLAAVPNERLGRSAVPVVLVAAVVAVLAGWWFLPW